MARLGEIHGRANGCAACGQQFGALAQFDAHQDVDYDREPAIVCRAPDSLSLVQDDRGVWQTPEGLAAQEAFQAKARARMASSRPSSRAQTPAEPDPVSR